MRPQRSAARRLPTFPWDRLVPYAQIAARHPGGVVDLSVGTPVDASPQVARDALTAAADAPGYPRTEGTPALRTAVRDWFARTLGVRGLTDDAVIPTVGSKELVALLPLLLGAGPGDRVLLPTVAYPTYDVGARLAGATPVPTDDPAAHDPAGVALVWLNSPGNPTGEVLDVGRLRAAVAWGRAYGVPVVADECYITLAWEPPAPVSVLHPDVCGADHAGVLAVHSLSKRSNLAGYRAGVLAGDPRLVAAVLAVRKHAGLIPPAPVVAAMARAYADDRHADLQREVYRRRRAVLRAALVAAGYRVEASTAGLYLWVTREEDCWTTVGALAAQGILVAPGAFYGTAGERHVRVALTATDERVAAAAARLGGSAG